MPTTTITLADDPKRERRLLITIEGKKASALVRDGYEQVETIEVDVTTLGWVLSGLDYQASGPGGFFMVQAEGDEVRVEFRGLNDLTISRCVLGRGEFESRIQQLQFAASPSKRAGLL